LFLFWLNREGSKKKGHEISGGQGLKEKERTTKGVFCDWPSPSHVFLGGGSCCSCVIGEKKKGTSKESYSCLALAGVEDYAAVG